VGRMPQPRATDLAVSAQYASQGTEYAVSISDKEQAHADSTS
jgi:hypothetical protein